jgi:PTS system glucose-specific IIC component
VIGAVVACLYNKYKSIQLPKYIGFFSGVRFIPIVTFFATCGIGLIFAMV